MPDPHPGVTRLIEVMDRLRSPGGCPWDAQQTPESLAEYLVEETYELLEAIDSGDRAHWREELGDVLLQVVFQSRIAQEDPVDPFTIDDVAEGVADKLIGRHPHVFGDADAPTAEHVERNWERLKAAEKGRETPLAGVPQALPPLTAIQKIRSRAGRAGLADQLVPPAAGAGAGDPEQEFGDRLLTEVLAAAADGIDAERALRGAVRRARQRVEEAAERP